MSTATLETLPEFWRLSVKQRLFIQTLVQSALDGDPDPVLATAVAYSTPHARTMSYYVLGSPKVKAVLKTIRKSGKRNKSSKRKAVKDF